MIALNPYHFHKLKKDVILPSLKCIRDKEETIKVVVVREFESSLT
jgi:hypothetical protein